jgi:glycosyltransferase involved in cell wall biosynthesis/predicted metal-dependent phosphoesterase TrpH
VRVDLHCHSAASAAAAGASPAIPECATAPNELYELAKRRGMDFVTITDHDTIAGVLQLSGQPDVFLSEELTAWFRGEPQAVHVLCFGITPDDHEWLQAHASDVVACADYLLAGEIACALAHPFVAVAAPLTAAHRHTLSELFAIWETHNGRQPRELNGPAAVYVETHGGVGIGGSDDHAGIDVGTTYTEAPPAATPDELLAHIRAGRVSPHGRQGTVAKSAHGALALAARALGAPLLGAADELTAGPRGRQAFAGPEGAVQLAERVIAAGDGREAMPLGPADGRRLLRGWLGEIDPELDTSRLLASMQAPDFRHSDLERRARRVHERRLTEAARAVSRTDRHELLDGAAAATFTATLPALPYLAAATRHARDRALLAATDDEPVRVAVIADGLGGLPGVTHTLAQLRERGVAGYEVDVIGTDAPVDVRLPAAAELELPLFPGVKLGVPSLFAVAEALTDRRYGLLHVCGPGPAALAATALARALGLPVAGSYDTELPKTAAIRLADPGLAQSIAAMVGAFYGSCDLVLSPSRAADSSLIAIGVQPDRIGRWERGVDLERFNPARYSPEALPSGTFNVLYAGRLAHEKGLDVLAEAMLIARDRNPRLHLVLAGRGPDEQRLRARLDAAATFLGWVEGDDLAHVYASADLLVFPSTIDTFGQAVLEAQASGVPVLAVDHGAHVELIEHGRSGCLVPADTVTMAAAIRGLSRRAAICERLATGGLLAARQRTWERSLQQLAAAWTRATAEPRRTTSTRSEVARAA